MKLVAATLFLVYFAGLAIAQQDGTPFTVPECPDCPEGVLCLVVETEDGGQQTVRCLDTSE
jgi:hypothetical protein